MRRYVQKCIKLHFFFFPPDIQQHKRMHRHSNVKQSQTGKRLTNQNLKVCTEEREHVYDNITTKWIVLCYIRLHHTIL